MFHCHVGVGCFFLKLPGCSLMTLANKFAAKLPNKHHHLGFNYLFVSFHPNPWGNDPICNIFWRWVGFHHLFCGRNSMGHHGTMGPDAVSLKIYTIASIWICGFGEMAWDRKDTSSKMLFRYHIYIYRERAYVSIYIYFFIFTYYITCTNPTIHLASVETLLFLLLDF